MSKNEFSHCYEYNDGQWKQLQEKDCQTQFNEQSDLKIGTYNILWGMSNPILNTFIRNNKRFDYILNQLIPQCDPDILSLMEVSQDFIKCLLLNSNIQKNYYISHIEKRRKDTTHEVLIISKQPFSTIFVKDDSIGRCMFSIFSNKIEWKSFIVTSSHLQAYEGDHKRRQKQLNLINIGLKTQTFFDNDSIPDYTKKIAQIANKQNNIILQGDLNLHMKFEDQFIYENEFIDIWREVYPNEEGYTWDSQKNSMINSIYIFDNRRMRLDRILLRQRCKIFSIKDMAIKGQEQIGYRLNCSDHYLLLSTLKFNQQPIEIVQQYDTTQINTEQTTGFRSMTTVIKMRILLLVLLVLFTGGLFTKLPLTLKK